MKKKLFIIINAFIVLGGSLALLFVLSLKGEEIVVGARYLQLACERCYHMEVEVSDDKKMNDTIIIPLSSNLSIETLIDISLQKKENLCLLGKPYLFNINIFNIDPDGRRFEVIEHLPSSRCAKL
ncbi:hypothetical protein [Agarilytica rhodophyticola]|uniref:hypothetical protein n=1 Tax=Agarilytica rhodophyticola TaxID=1737490 RepID=UPI000B34554F|nr:hypothetical protein [Agarilytica rhodophyticola]